MRVQLRTERGAVAVMVALLALTLFGMAAFAVDAGSAYNAKRQLSTAADAASLAGAAAVKGYSGNCTSVMNNSAATAAAQTAGDNYLTRNRPGSTRVDAHLQCSADNKAVEFFYQDTGKVDATFSRIFGISSLSATRDATASLDVPPDAPGLRPYMICSDDLDDLSATWKQFNFPNDVCGKPSGNWYTVDCPANGEANGNPVIAETTKHGCPSDIHIIDTTAFPTTALKIAHLDAACVANAALTKEDLSANPGCLTGNTGELSNNLIYDAWRYLTGVADENGGSLATPVPPKSILLPVFLAGSQFSHGNNAVYPVYAFVGATVCGFYWGKNKTAVSNFAPCTGATFTAPLDKKGKPDDGFNALLLAKATVMVSGSTGGAICAIGDPACDFGARRVRLTK